MLQVVRKVSFVIPCYRSEKTIEFVVEEIIKTMQEQGHLLYEIILVNDASPDGLQDVLVLLAKNSNIKIISLSKNFGQHSALMAGYQYCTGEVIVSLDDDGQTPANEVFRLLEILEKGFDVVYAAYEDKKHTFLRNVGSKINDWMAEVLIEKPKTLKVSSYFAMKHFVMKEVLNYKGPYPYLLGLILRITKKIDFVFVSHRKRQDGQSGYTFGKLLSLWLNGFTAFSVRPLRIATLLGCLCAFFGFLYGIVVVMNKLTNPQAPVGYSSLMATLLFIGGMLMLMLGLIGEYIGRIYINMNQAPQYVIKETMNLN